MSEIVVLEVEQFRWGQWSGSVSGSKWLNETGKTLGNEIQETRSQGVGWITHISSLMEELGGAEQMEAKDPS